uniref:Helicase ATP-binding domain-containing protein n=1 Tax=viral metagenome TaxID=1070528 RepID=A0A6C0JUS6_9ZZZZ
MSCDINNSSLFNQPNEILNKLLTIYDEQTETHKTLINYTSKNDKILTLIPFAYKTPSKLLKIQDSSYFDILRDSQKEVLEELKSDSCFFNLPTGYGKTVIGLFLAHLYKLKTLILIPREDIKVQWINVKKSLFTIDSDLIEISMELSFWNKINREKDKRICYDMVIVDECHMNTDLIFTKILLSLETKYLFAFSASDRIDLFCHHYFKQTISRFEIKNISVFPIFLRYKPEEMKRFIKGKIRLDYTKMLSKLSENTKRLDDIVNNIYKIVEFQKEKNTNNKTIILTKYVPTLKYIYTKLSTRYHIDAKYGNKDKYCPNASILIGTFGKIGVGFDERSSIIDIHSKIYKNEGSDKIIKCSDKNCSSHTGITPNHTNKSEESKEYYPFQTIIMLDNVLTILQAEGRIREYSFCLFDFVDDHSMFINHWNKRLEWYIERGGTIYNTKEYLI